MVKSRRRASRQPELTWPDDQLLSAGDTAPAAINKKLALWRSVGIVDTGRGAIVIRNCEALRALVGCV
jgi:hypothetical protein